MCVVSAAFISLLDNYESDTGEPEIVTPEEVAENHKFLDSIIQTPTMKVPVGTDYLPVLLSLTEANVYFKFNEKE